MKIRRIEKKDNLRVAEIIRECLTEYGGDHRTDTAWGDPYLERFSEVYVLENNAYWVAENEDGLVVAGVGIGPMDGVEGICELQKMYCIKDYRGTGIAGELLDIALEFAKKYYSRCYLETMDNMYRAQKFYEKKGFYRTSETIGSTGHDGCQSHYIIDF
ncbi:MAG: GNAT family N-acetyltransferase [Clostridiales bacterium]|nr:GNAT family N-acetyltransferase [Candidatus Blautia equi]